MKMLFNGELQPITNEIGFLECDEVKAHEAYVAWIGPIMAQHGRRLSVEKVEGDFRTRLLKLLPLTSVQRRRELFLPTQSGWTAYFDNGWRGTDAFSAVSYLAELLGCRGIKAVSVDDTMAKPLPGRGGRYGATILEMYTPLGPDRQVLNIARSIYAVNDGGKWRFDAGGPPFDFENESHFNAKRVKDRFTPEILDDYLRHLGIEFFSEAFYECRRPAYLVSLSGPMAPGTKEYTLAEAMK
ncbi:MAG: hypothetical protein AABZ53_07085 [Planctomycetota bacterium]